MISLRKWRIALRRLVACFSEPTEMENRPFVSYPSLESTEAGDTRHQETELKYTGDFCTSSQPGFNSVIYTQPRSGAQTSVEGGKKRLARTSSYSKLPNPISLKDIIQKMFDKPPDLGDRLKLALTLASTFAPSRGGRPAAQRIQERQSLVLSRTEAI
jgi:hypothetical protein